MVQVFNISDPQHIKKATDLFIDLRNSPNNHVEIIYQIEEFEVAFKKFAAGLTCYLCNPFERSREKNEVDTIEKIVHAFPNMLRYSDGLENLPIHKAASDELAADIFVPLLAKCAVNLLDSVKDDTTRGGLTAMNKNNRTPLGMIARRGDVKTFEKLCNMEPPLVNKEDVIECSLLHHAACNGTNSEMVESIIKFNPDALYSQKYYANYLPIHASCCDGGSIDISSLLFERAVHHDTTNSSIGGLFKKDKYGRMAITKMINRYGPTETWKFIEKTLSTLKEVPIIHYTIMHAPQYVDDFLLRFPHACFLRDKDGRLPVHVALECGLQWSISLVSIMNTNATYLGDVDPVTGFCLCGLAAMQPSCDLRTINYLIRTHPRQLELHRTSTKAVHCKKQTKDDDDSNLPPNKRQKTTS